VGSLITNHTEFPMRVLILALFTLCLGLAAEEPAKLPAEAQAAIDKAESDIAKVRQTLIATLTKCRTNAMHKDDLAGALAIKAKVDEVTALLPKLLTVDPPPAAAEPPSLVGTWNVIKTDGTKKCMLEIAKNGINATEIPSGVTGVIRKETIFWSNGSSWALAFENATWTVTASDGKLTLQK
jgi:hypothetical protein